jgi:hypothetical protein
MFRSEAEVRIALCANPSPSWAGLVRKFYRMLSLKTLVFSNGVVLHQLDARILPSGTYVTGPSNSHQRVRAAFAVGAERAAVMGDDCIESRVSNAQLLYQALGLELKEYLPWEEHPEFCSFMWLADRHYPVNTGKQVFAYLGGEISTERTSALLDLHEHSPDRELVYQAVQRVILAEVLRLVEGEA